MCRRWSPTAVSADAKQRGARQHIMGRRRHDDPPPQGLRAARCRTARCRVKLYGASTTRRPTAARRCAAGRRRCAAGRRRSSVTVSADAGLRGAGLRGAGQHCMGRRWHDNPPPPVDVLRTGDVRRGRRRSSVTVSADAKQRRRSNQRMSHPYSWMGAWTWCCGAKWRHRGGTTDRGEAKDASVTDKTT